VLLITALLIVVCWPPENDKSLALKLTNWVVDPAGELPTLPAQLGYGVGDDPLAVEEHDARVRRYDELHNAGGWTRRRLRLKVADDPFNRSTTRQVLLGAGILVAFVVWRKSSGPSTKA
jgi:hypothetical protein